ncbi:MAG: rRNA maturation RNase YbeY [Acidimicrobiia bacterium]|nr:rRNA maturation RNase YbeY [Acidimicrobiia bacterium]MCY4434955.1 rRNA maturation RNase YbeY [bacterium]
MTADSDTGPKPTAADINSSAVVVSDHQQDLPVAQDRLVKLICSVLAEEGVEAPWETGLSFVTADEMAALNAAHRGIDQPTDVLAFGADDGSAPRAADEPRLVGDVVICPAVAATNAAARNKAVDEELALLVVHGALHLLGYDHIDDADAEKMEQRELELLSIEAATLGLTGTKAGST